MLSLIKLISKSAKEQRDQTHQIFPRNEASIVMLEYPCFREGMQNGDPGEAVIS